MSYFSPSVILFLINEEFINYKYYIINKAIYIHLVQQLIKRFCKKQTSTEHIYIYLVQNSNI